MSVYSSGNVKTKLLEPSTYNENVSCEFRITEPCLPNIRLIDVGSKNQADTQYNPLLGAYACLRSVFLYSGQMLLDGTPNIQEYMAFRQYNKSNEVNKNISKVLVRNQLGFNIDQNEIYTNAPTENNQSGTTDATTALAYLPLSAYCPLLEKLNVLDPSEMKNLRLVLEFEPDRKRFLTATNTTSHNTRRPRLIMDVLAPGSFQGNPAAVSWNAIESDRFPDASLVLTGKTSKRATTSTLNGFNNKMVGRILMVKTFQDSAADEAANNIIGFGQYASHAMKDESIQVVLNGGQILPRNGVEGANAMLSMLNDTWGQCNTLPYGNQLAITTAARYNAALQPKISQQSYFGCFLNSRVKNLQVIYTRTGLQDNSGNQVDTNQALDVLVYGEVSKSLVMKGGEVNVVYN